MRARNLTLAALITTACGSESTYKETTVEMYAFGKLVDTQAEITPNNITIDMSQCIYGPSVATMNLADTLNDTDAQKYLDEHELTLCHTKNNAEFGMAFYSILEYSFRFSDFEGLPVTVTYNNENEILAIEYRTIESDDTSSPATNEVYEFCKTEEECQVRFEEELAEFEEFLEKLRECMQSGECDPDEFPQAAIQDFSRHYISQ